MRVVVTSLGLLAGLWFVGCSGTASYVKQNGECCDGKQAAGAAVLVSAVGGSADDDEDFPLDQLPQNVKDAALGAVAGIVLTAAERETENGVVIYSIAGTANGKSYEVEVSTAGVVLEIEDEDDDEDDDDDDDHDDDDSEAG